MFDQLLPECPLLLPRKSLIRACQKMPKIRQLLVRAMREVRESSLPRSPQDFGSKRRSEDSSQSESIQEVFQNLRKGYLMRKHSQKTCTHDKFVYLSEDQRFIGWKSLDRNDEKRIKISSIIKVVKEDVEFYLKGSHVKNISRCLVIVGTQRNLQLQAVNQNEAEIFKYELDRVIKHSKSFHLNYRFSM